MDTAISKLSLSTPAMLLLAGIIFALGAISGPFLNEAGKDLYSLFKTKVLKRLPNGKLDATDVTPSAAVVSSPARVAEASASASDVPLSKLAPGPKPRIERVSAIAFTEVREAFDKAPPMQREHNGKSYEGLRVQWEGTFSSADSIKDRARVTMYATDKLISQVSFEVPLVEYPELKIMHAGRRLRVVGTIKEVGILVIRLDDVDLTILD